MEIYFHTYVYPNVMLKHLCCRFISGFCFQFKVFHTGRFKSNTLHVTLVTCKINITIGENVYSHVYPSLWTHLCILQWSFEENHTVGYKGAHFNEGNSWTNYISCLQLKVYVANFCISSVVSLFSSSHPRSCHFNVGEVTSTGLFTK